MEQDNILIKLKGIDYGYPEKELLFNNLNFTFNKGDKVGIIGSNGSGKTTLLYIIMGLIAPHNGEIVIFNKLRRKEKDFDEVRKRIGFLFQNSDDQLFCPSVEEEIAFGPLNFGFEKEEVKRIVKRTLNLVGLNGFEKRVPYFLSGGEKRRLALATVFATDPEILILDEPILGLDETTVKKIKEILSSEDLSYIVVSQNRDFLKDITNIIYTIKNRNLVLENKV